ncbi:hypothetical protein APHAL10511_003743 [Amanita phalloides]|nr:hypothetical protein APHAL10511_003743 [Amanita phalloides]
MHPKADDLATVRKLIASLDFANDNVQHHKDIYTYISETILASQSTILNIEPPVEVLVYVAKKILFPNLAQNMIPQLLDVVANVEFYRQRMQVQAKTALKGKNSHMNEDNSKTISLSNDDEVFLEKLEVSSDSWRQVYMTILCKCCHLDLYHLWTASPPSMVDFMVRFNEYFPSLNKHCTHESPRLLHQMLSTDERSKFKQTGLSISEFGYNSAQWVKDNTREESASLHRPSALIDTSNLTANLFGPCSTPRNFKELSHLPALQDIW